MLTYSSPLFPNDAFSLEAVFEALPGTAVLVKTDAPSYTILNATSGFFKQANRARESFIGKGTFEAFPGNSSDANDTGSSALRASYDHVVAKKEPHSLPIQRYDLQAEDGSFSEHYWRASNNPVLGADGEVAYIIHATEDITHEIKAREQEEKIKGLEQAYGLFMQAPFAIHIFTGPELIIDLANPPTLELWGKKEDITGKRFLDVLPELKGQGFDTMMHEVMQTGHPKFFYEVPLALNRPGKEPVGYFNFVYQPYYKEGAVKAESVLIIANEVTPQVLAKKKIEESEAKLNNIIEQTPAPTLVLRGDDYLIEYVNNPMMKMMGRGEEVNGQPFLSIMPELKGQYAWEQVQRVYHTGESFDQWEVLVPHNRTGVMQDYYYNVSYRPLKEESRITGMIQVAIDVTEQVVSRKKLEESEERYRTLLEETTVATAFYTGPEVRVQYANATMLRYWGKGGEVIGKTFRQALPELDGQPFPALLEAVFATGEPYIGTEEKAELVVDGELQPFYFNFTYKALRDAAGQVYAIHHTAIDVTEQVTARKKIEQSEGNLTNLVLQAPVGICVMNADTLVTEIVNDAYVEIAGKPYEAIYGRYFWDIFPEAAPYYEAALQGVIDSGDAFHAMEVPLMLIRHGKEENRHVTFVYEPMKDVAGNVKKIVVWAMDNTGQVIARQKIEEQAAAFLNAVEIAELGTWTMNVETGLTIFSERHAELWGFDTIETTAEEALAHVVEKDRDRVTAAFFNALQPDSDGHYEAEYEIANPKTGERLIVRAMGQTFYDKERKPLTITGTTQDVTIQRKTQDALENKVQQRTKELAEANESLNLINRELQRSNQNLEEFAHAASHDLKEPVRKIHFFTNQLKDQLSSYLKEADTRSFNRIEKATERMGALIDDLLLYSHVSQRPHETEAINLNEKVKRVMEDLELDIQEKRAVINVGELPVVQGYRRQLQQLFQNLISNALKYSKADVPPVIEITASIVTEANRPYHVITVADNGIGFDQQYADKIFQMFARLHGKSEYSGTGVGLSIVKKVVENHHGFITVKSSTGEGATFIVWLPAKEG